MRTPRIADHLRANQLIELDKQLGKWRWLKTPMPREGWARAIRQALGMTPQQLGRRAGLTLGGLSAAELSEAAGKVEFATLRKLAAGLNCDLVYALVPREPMHEFMARRRRELAQRDLRALRKSMTAREWKSLLPAYGDRIAAARLWEK